MTNVEAVERADYEYARVRERLGKRTRPFDVARVRQTPTEVVLEATRKPFSFVARFEAAARPGGTRVTYERKATPSGGVTAALFRLAGGVLRRGWKSAMRREIRRAAAAARDYGST
jgi:hypothetical protein